MGSEMARRAARTAVSEVGTMVAAARFLRSSWLRKAVAWVEA